jgi:hypothetical protein
MKLDRPQYAQFTFTDSELSHLKMMALNYMFSRPDASDPNAAYNEENEYRLFKLSTDSANLTWYGSKILATTLLQQIDFIPLIFVSQNLEDRMIFVLFKLCEYVADNVITDADFSAFIESRLDFITSHVRSQDYTSGTAIESEYNLTLADAQAIKAGTMDTSSEDYAYNNSVDHMCDIILSKRAETDRNTRLLRNRRTVIRNSIRTASSRQEISDILAAYGREVYL